MLIGFRAGDDATMRVKRDDWAGTRRALALPAGTAPLGRVFPDKPNFSVLTKPADVVAHLEASCRPVIEAGMWPFWSLKPNPADAIAGRLAPHFAAIGRWCYAAGVPTYGAFWHEPENNTMGARPADYRGRAQAYVKTHSAGYVGVKDVAGDTVSIGPVNMSYHWRPGSETTATPDVIDAWRVPEDFRDFWAIDTYTANSNWAPTGQTLALKRDFQRWRTALGVPDREILVAERGVSNNYPGAAGPDVAQAVTVRADYDYLASLDAHGLMYWNSGGATDSSIYLMSPATRAVFTAIAVDAAERIAASAS